MEERRRTSGWLGWEAPRGDSLHTGHGGNPAHGASRPEAASAGNLPLTREAAEKGPPQTSERGALEIRRSARNGSKKNAAGGKPDAFGRGELPRTAVIRQNLQVPLQPRRRGSEARPRRRRCRPGRRTAPRRLPRCRNLSGSRGHPLPPERGGKPARTPVERILLAHVREEDGHLRHLFRGKPGFGKDPADIPEHGEGLLIAARGWSMRPVSGFWATCPDRKNRPSLRVMRENGSPAGPRPIRVTVPISTAAAVIGVGRDVRLAPVLVPAEDLAAVEIQQHRVAGVQDGSAGARTCGFSTSTQPL